MSSLDVFDEMESEVKTYCRSFPKVFSTASNAELVDEDGNRYIDFLAGAGTLNYGHNNQQLVNAVTDYLGKGGVLHSLDFHTEAKRDFMVTLRDVILKPRGYNYKIQFTGPTGTNAVEAALKLARKVTGRTTIAAFTNGFHGVTLGALAATATSHRGGAGVPLNHVVRLPYDGWGGKDTDTLGEIRELLTNPGNGMEAPAAFIVETVQGEGGINTAGNGWLRGLAQLAKDIGALLIVDDIQAGCGRTGTFFSFEPAGIEPDIVCISKSIGGIGLPMAICLLKPEHDKWSPGEHNGTFRGHNLAFVAAKAALDHYWRDDQFINSIQEKSQCVDRHLQKLAAEHKSLISELRGRGMMRGIVFSEPGFADAMSRQAFSNGLILETCGPEGEVLKLLCPLTIEMENLQRGLDIIKDSLASLSAMSAAS